MIPPFLWISCCLPPTDCCYDDRCKTIKPKAWCLGNYCLTTLQQNGVSVITVLPIRQQDGGLVNIVLPPKQNGFLVIIVLPPCQQEGVSVATVLPLRQQVGVLIITVLPPRQKYGDLVIIIITPLSGWCLGDHCVTTPPVRCIGCYCITTSDSGRAIYVDDIFYVMLTLWFAVKYSSVLQSKWCFYYDFEKYHATQSS